MFDLNPKTLVLNDISNTWIMPYVNWGVKLCSTLVSGVGDNPSATFKTELQVWGWVWVPKLALSFSIQIRIQIGRVIKINL
jgi:hypothetical protein